jgi:hypothetical protein
MHFALNGKNPVIHSRQVGRDRAHHRGRQIPGLSEPDAAGCDPDHRSVRAEGHVERRPFRPRLRNGGEAFQSLQEVVTRLRALQFIEGPR